MLNKLKPCPFCKNKKGNRIDDNGDGISSFVWCDGCGACGPSGDSEKEAAEKWNAALRYPEADISKVETTEKEDIRKAKFRNTKYTMDEVFDKIKGLIREAWTP